VTALHQEFLAPRWLSEPEERSAAAPDGAQVHGWLLKPPDFDPAKRYPLILKIHGGPHTQYGCTFFHEFQLLAARGYLVLYANPRGSKGYGQAWTADLKGRWGEADLPDLLALVNDAIATGRADPARLGAAGRIHTPLLILHSEGDLRCPIEQADQLFAALRRLRRPVEYIRYPPEADHGLTRTGPPDLRLDRLDRILAWFDAHLG